MEKKVRRTKEELIAEIETKIQYHKDCIIKLEAKKEGILNPKYTRGRGRGLPYIFGQAKKMGLSAEEVAEKLGISLE